jgi:hypothetical protein
MSRDSERSIEIHFKNRPLWAELTKAVVRKGEIRFNVSVTAEDRHGRVADGLRHSFALIDSVPNPVRIEDRGVEFTVVYQPRGRRSLQQDMRWIARALAESNVAVTPEVMDGMEEAFEAFKSVAGQERPSAVESEAARRGTARGPRGRGSP